MSTGGQPVFEIEGEIRLDDSGVAERLKQLEAEAKRLYESFKAGEINFGQWQAALRRVRKELGDVGYDVSKTGELIESTTAKVAQAGNNVVTTTASVRGGSRNMGMAVLEGSRALEDLQFGLVGVVNNIPSLVSSLGGTAGVAGAISVVAVGVYQLVRNWDDILDSFGVGIPQPALDGLDALNAKLDETNERLTELQEKSRLTLPEFQELEKLKFEQKETEREIRERTTLDDVFNAPTESERERGQAFKESVVELGAADVGRELELRLGRQAVNGQVRSEALDQTADPETIARNLFLRALEGSESALQEIIGTLGEQSRFGKAITAGTPEAQAQREALAKQGQENEEEARRQQREAERAAEQEQREIEQYIAEDERESARRLQQRERDRDQAERERERRVEGLAAPFGEGQARIAALRGRLGEEEVAARLGRAGIGDADAVAGAVARVISESIAREIQDRAVSAGITEDEARRQLLNEARREQAGQPGELMKLLLRQDDLARQMAGPVRSIEQFGAASLQERIQTAGGDEQDRMRRQLEAVIQSRDIQAKILEVLRRQGLGGPAVVS